jgi:TPR repeat protein
MYKNGYRVPQDDHKAMEFYLKSANQENASAQNNIGIHSFHSNIILTTDYFDLNRCYV